MASIKDKLYRNLSVTIDEFTLLAIGYFDFNNFHKYQTKDLNYVLESALLIYFNADIELFKKALKEGKVFTNTKQNLMFKVYKRRQENFNLITIDFFRHCERFLSSDLLAVEQLRRLLNDLKEYHKDVFPVSIKGKASSIQPCEDTYNMQELIMCLYKNTNVTDIKFSPYFQSAFSDLDKTNDTVDSESDNKDGYVKIDTLPLDMQFIIECHSEPSYQHSHVYNKEKQLTSFKDDTVLKMIELSKKRKLTHIHQRKQLSGLPKTKVDNIFDFIQNK